MHRHDGRNMTQQVSTAPDIRHISNKGRELFKALPPELVEKHRGQFVAIEVDSGECFIAKTAMKANERAREKRPGKVFYLGRIGCEAAFKRPRLGGEVKGRDRCTAHRHQEPRPHGPCQGRSNHAG